MHCPACQRGRMVARAGCLCSTIDHAAVVQRSKCASEANIYSDDDHSHYLLKLQRFSCKHLQRPVLISADMHRFAADLDGLHPETPQERFQVRQLHTDPPNMPLIVLWSLPSASSTLTCVTSPSWRRIIERQICFAKSRIR